MKTAIAIGLCILAVATGVFQSFALRGFKRDGQSKTSYVFIGCFIAIGLTIGLWKH